MPQVRKLMKCKECGELRPCYGKLGLCEKCYKKMQMQDIEYKKRQRKAQYEWLKKHPEYQKIKNETYKQFKKKTKCEICGSREQLEFHHLNYHPIKVITVCKYCHRNVFHRRTKLYKLHK